MNRFDWMPIVTAPKDGRPVFVAWAGNKLGRWAVWDGNDRILECLGNKENVGPGWRCYFTGHSLTTMTHWLDLQGPDDDSPTVDQPPKEAL